MIKLSKLLAADAIYVKFYEVFTEDDMHHMLKACKRDGWITYGLDLSLEQTKDFLDVALMEGMIKFDNSFLILNLDAQLLDLSAFQHNLANITMFSLLSDSAENAHVLREMDEYSYLTVQNPARRSSKLSVRTLLTHDAIQTLRRALAELGYDDNMQQETRVTCENECTLEAGHTIYNYINAAQWRGLSGDIRLEGGKRNDYSVNVLQLVEHEGLQKISGYRFRDGRSQYNQWPNLILRSAETNKVPLLVTAIIEEPFLMYATDYKELTGNARYVGFCADLLQKISYDLGFQYTINICVNCTYGAPDDNNVWGGMVGELVNKRADLALGSFTINYKREQVIDLTKPFMHIGISILYKVPNKETPGLFSFMEPIAIETWFLVVLAYVLVSFSLYILARFSPYERTNHISDGTNERVKEFKLSLVDSFWFAICMLIQQGSEVCPSAASTRVVGSFWWLFSLFVVSSYTANLAAFLTIESTVTPINNAEGLSQQTEIKYGTLINGSSWLFFKESKIETYQQMWSFMSSNSQMFVDSYEEGVKRVKAGGYALLMESAALDYKVQKNCGSLMQIGGLLDSKGYGIGTQQNSPWRDLMSSTILKLQENGYIHEIYNKWWKLSGACKGDKGKSETASALDLQNVGGIFIILLIGLGTAFCTVILERVYKIVRSNMVKPKDLYKPDNRAQNDQKLSEVDEGDKTCGSDYNENSVNPQFDIMIPPLKQSWTGNLLSKVNAGNNPNHHPLTAVTLDKSSNKSYDHGCIASAGKEAGCVKPKHTNGTDPRHTFV